MLHFVQQMQYYLMFEVRASLIVNPSVFCD